MQQEQTPNPPHRKDGKANAAAPHLLPHRKVAHPLADWLNVTGDLDDFIFYNESHHPSTR